MSTVGAPGRDAPSRSHAEQHSLGRRRPRGRQAGPVLALAILVGAAMPTAARAQENAPPASAQLTEVAKRFLAAVRDGNNQALMSVVIESGDWSAERWAKTDEMLRKPYASQPERLTTIRETLVDGDAAAVRVAGPPGPQDQCMDLFLQRLPAGWRVASFANWSSKLTLRQTLDVKINYLLAQRAVNAEKAGDAAGAQAAYKALVERSPLERLRYAEFLRKQGMFDEAIKLVKAHYADNPGFHYVLETLSRLYAESGRIPEAIEAREQLLTRMPYCSPGNRKELLDLWLKRGDTAQARTHYLAVAEDPKAEPPRTVLAHLMLADMALADQKPDEARKHFWLAIEKLLPAKDQWPERTFHGILDQFIALEWLDDAVKAYRREPVPELLTRLGERLKRGGRGQEMLALYRESIFSDPSPGPRYAGEGVFYGFEGLAGDLIRQLVELGEGPALIEQLRARIAEQPRAPHLRRNLGYLLFQLKRYPEGLRELEELPKVTGRASASYYRWLGDLCRNASLADEAIAYYEKALKTEVTPEEIRYGSFMSQRAMSETESLAAFKMRILEALGRLYKQKRQWADAERSYQAILDLKPPWGAEQAKAALAEVWKAMGKENPILKELEAKVAREPDNAAVRREMARALQDAGKPAEAVAHLQHAVKLSPEDPAPRLDLARALAKANQLDAAVEQYEQVLREAVRREVPRGKVVVEVEPISVLREVERLCEPAGKTDRLLGICKSLLALKGPDVKWSPSEYELRSILDTMTTILRKRGDHAAALALWIEHHERVPDTARHAVRKIGPPPEVLEPAIKQLQEIARKNPKDFCARFMLGDILYGLDRRDEASQVYTALARDAGDDRRVHEDVGYELERLGHHREALAEYETALRLCKTNSPEYLNRLRILASLNLRMGNTAQAAAQYREALKLDPTSAEYREGLSKATDGKEPAAERPAPAAEDVAAKRSRADILASKGQYAEAIALYNEVLAKASTDVEAMVGLARALEKTGKNAEALAMFEKAHAMRRWSPVSLGVDGELERVYVRDKADDKLIALYTEKRYYSGVWDFYRNRKQPDKFRQWVLAQIEKSPKEAELRWYLVLSYTDTGDKAAALRELEAMRKDLSTEDGKIRDARFASLLADAYERLDDPRSALDCMAAINYADDPDSNDWTGSRLTRLYAKTNQFAKALETCGLRLRKDTRGDRAITIGQEIAGYASAAKDGPKLLDAFLAETKGKIPDRTYDRFAGAVRAYFLAHPARSAEADDLPLAEDPAVLLLEGRKVQAPKTARNMADFLEKLAAEAQSAVEGTFPRAAQRLPAPTLKEAEGPALELLAQALNGLPASLETTESGRWSINEKGDPTSKVFYAAIGGAIARVECVNRRPDRPLWALGRLMFDPALQRHVVSLRSEMNVLEATDEAGRDLPAVQVRPFWSTGGQISFNLKPQDPPPKKIAMVRVETAVVLATQWATLTAPRLDHQQAITLEKNGVTIRFAPLRTVDRAGRKEWEIPLVVSRPESRAQERLRGLRGEMHFVTQEGKTLRVGSWSGGGSPEGEEIRIHTPPNAFDPATTSLVVRRPAVVKVVPIVLTFRDLPVVDR